MHFLPVGRCREFKVQTFYCLCTEMTSSKLKCLFEVFFFFFKLKGMENISIQILLIKILRNNFLIPTILNQNKKLFQLKFKVDILGNGFLTLAGICVLCDIMIRTRFVRFTWAKFGISPDLAFKRVSKK